MGRIAVTGSVAFDTIMVFPGRFGDHILPERTHVLNVSFQVDRLERRRGGTAANIAYTLALLGERPLLCGAVGAADFDEYAAELAKVGVDTSTVLRAEGVGTGTCYITTDLDDNQITAFFSGAMARAGDVDLSGLQDISDVVVGADAAVAMARHARQSSELGARLTFAPAQQIPSMSDADLRDGLDRAWLIVANDYEMEMIRERTGATVDELRSHATVAVTRGATGSRLHSAAGVVEVPAAPVSHVVDPTGAGDAYIAGLLASLRAGASPAVAGRVAAVAGAYVVEQRGPQAHSFTPADLAARYQDAFGTALPAGALPGSAARA